MGSNQSQQIQDEVLWELPQYFWEQETKSKVRVLPLVQRMSNQEKDTKNLSALLSPKIECKLTLGELLKVKRE